METRGFALFVCHFGTGITGPWSLTPLDPQRRQEQVGVAGDGQGRLTVHRLTRPDLGLPHADQLLLVTMIDLDVPTPEIILQEFRDRQVRGRCRAGKPAGDKATCRPYATGIRPGR